MSQALNCCVEFADNFPQDRRTALNFIECRFAQNAMRVACTEEQYDAILKCFLAAHDVLQKTSPTIEECVRANAYAAAYPSSVNTSGFIY